MTPADFYPGHSPRGRLPVKGPLPLLGRSSHFRGPPPAEGAAAGDRRPGEPASHRPSGVHWRFHARAGTRGPQRPPQGTGPPRASSRAISRCQLANGKWQMANGKWQMAGARGTDRALGQPSGQLPATPPRLPTGKRALDGRSGQERGLAEKKRLHPVCPQVGLIPSHRGRVPFGNGFAGNFSAPAPGTHPRDLGGGPGVLPPSRPPALPGTMMGRCVLHKSSQGSG